MYICMYGCMEVWIPVISACTQTCKHVNTHACTHTDTSYILTQNASKNTFYYDIQ